MLEFLRRIFSPEPRSSETAKERLRLVLLSDHLSLAPDVVEALKRDLLAVISRYLEIDPTQADVTFEQREREVAMLASIPITGVRDRSAALAENAPPPLLPQAPVLQSAPEPEAEPQAVEAQPEDEAMWEPGDAAPIEAPAPVVPPPGEAEASAPDDRKIEALQAQALDASRPPAAASSSARRRRRKKAAAALVNRVAPAHGSPEFGSA